MLRAWLEMRTGAQTQRPCGQIELAPDREGCAAPFLLIYFIVSVTTQAKRVNAHRNMNPSRDRGRRWLVRLLHLIERKGSQHGPPSLERDAHGVQFPGTCGL